MAGKSETNQEAQEVGGVYPGWSHGALRGPSQEEEWVWQEGGSDPPSGNPGETPGCWGQHC